MHIVITGVSRGLGRAMVDGFIRAEHSVSGCARSAEAIRSLAEQYTSPHRFDVVDVVEHGQVQAWARRVLESGGPPDILINNAALINSNARLWEVPVAEFKQVMDANVLGTYLVIREFVPAMIAAGQGTVVNFSSTWGRTTSPKVAPYCATKWAIEGLTQAMAADLPDGMAAVPLNPGIIDTDMLRQCFGKGAAAYPKAMAWADKAVPLILQLGPQDNGRQLTVN